MIKKIRGIAKTELIRTSFFTSIAVFVRIVAAFVLNKVVALYVGPAGVAVVGQFNNFFAVLNTLSTAGINAGVVKSIAENRQNDGYARKVISTAFILTLSCSLVVSAVVLIFSRVFSVTFFKTEQYNFVLVFIGISLTFAALNTLLMAFLNGHKEVVKYTWANIISSLFILTFSVLLGIYYKMEGVLVAMVTAQSAVFFITLLFVVKSSWFKVEYFFRYFDTGVLRKLSGFSLMAFTTAIAQPLALMVIRNYLGTKLSWEDAGCWQGVYSISEVYLMFITTSLSVYYLPRLSEITNPAELRKEILSTAKIVMPVVSLIALVIYLLKGPVVMILFTGKFTSMFPLFKYQLIGDVVKIAGFLLAYQMLAKSMIKIYLFTEVLFNLIFVLLVFALVPLFGLQGATLAFFANYVLYLLFLLFYFRKQIFVRWSPVSH